MKNEAIKRRNEYERQGEPYTAQMILSPRKSLSAVRNDLNGLISNYISEKGLKENTAYNWKYLFNLISEFDNKDVIVNELKLEYVKRFIKWMQNVKGRLTNGFSNIIRKKPQYFSPVHKGIGTRV